MEADTTNDVAEYAVLVADGKTSDGIYSDLSASVEMSKHIPSLEEEKQVSEFVKDFGIQSLKDEEMLQNLLLASNSTHISESEAALIIEHIITHPQTPSLDASETDALNQSFIYAVNLLNNLPIDTSFFDSEALGSSLIWDVPVLASVCYKAPQFKIDDVLEAFLCSKHAKYLSHSEFSSLKRVFSQFAELGNFKYVKLNKEELGNGAKQLVLSLIVHVVLGNEQLFAIKKNNKKVVCGSDVLIVDSVLEVLLSADQNARAIEQVFELYISSKPKAGLLQALLYLSLEVDSAFREQLVMRLLRETEVVAVTQIYHNLQVNEQYAMEQAVRLLQRLFEARDPYFSVFVLQVFKGSPLEKSILSVQGDLVLHIGNLIFEDASDGEFQVWLGSTFDEAPLSLVQTSLAVLVTFYVNKAQLPEEHSAFALGASFSLAVAKRLSLHQNLGQSEKSSLSLILAQDKTEHAVKELFHTIFAERRSIEEVLGLLKVYQTSPDPLRRDIHKAFSSSLVHEFQFLDKYPEKALTVIATVCGSVLEADLVPASSLQSMLSFLLVSLRGPMNLQFKFALIALSHFKQSLRAPSLQEFAQQVVQIPDLFTHFPELMADISSVVGPAQLDVSTDTNQTPVLRANDEQDFMVSLQRILPMPVLSEISMVSEEMQGKVSFVLNNLTMTNVDAKLQGMKDLLSQVDQEWFSDYLVAKRVMSQPNYHDTYVELLKKLRIGSLLESVKAHSLAQVRAKFERNLADKGLKNLGSWMGKLLLSQDEALLSRELDLKQLLLDGYMRGWLLTVMPFVQHLLLAVDVQSSVFDKHNPWIQGLLKTCQDIFNQPNLKLNLTFSMELIFKHFEFSATHETSLPHPPINSPDFKSQMIPNLVNYVKLPPDCHLHSDMVAKAIDESIRSIVTPVAERSVNMALASVTKLVAKDFSMESDDARVSEYARLAVGVLGGSLGHVTAKESLPKRLEQELRKQTDDGVLVGQLVYMNMNLACKLIEKACKEQATKELEARLPVQREPLVYNLPQCLMPDVNKTFYNIYEFKESEVTVSSVTARWEAVIASLDKLVNAAVAQDNVDPSVQKQVSARLAELTIPESLPSKDRQEVCRQFAERIFKGILKVSATLAKGILKESSSTLNRSNGERFKAQVQYAILDTVNKLSPITDQVTHWLFLSNTTDSLNLFATAGLIRARLIDICAFDEYLAKAIANAESIDALLPLVGFTIDLVKICLVNNQMVKRQEVAHTLDCLTTICKQPIIQQRLPKLAELLQQVEQPSSQLQKFVRQVSASTKHNEPGRFVRSTDLRDMRKAAMLLGKWMELYSEQGQIFSPGPHQTAYKNFLSTLQQSGTLSGDETTQVFFRLCLELVFESALFNVKECENKTAEEETAFVIQNKLSYLATDALSKLIVLLVNYVSGTGKPKLVERILSMVFQIYSLEERRRRAKGIKESMDQRPYRSFILFLIRDLTKMNVPSTINCFYSCLATGFSPFNTPSFCFAYISLLSNPTFMDPLISHCPHAAFQLVRMWLAYVDDKRDTSQIVLTKMYEETHVLLSYLFTRHPSLLSEGYVSLLAVLPRSFLRLRNIILSATPVVHTESACPARDVDVWLSMEHDVLTASVETNPGKEFFAQLLVKAQSKKSLYLLLTALVDNLRQVDQLTQTILEAIVACLNNAAVVEMTHRVLIERLVVPAPHPPALIHVAAHLKEYEQVRRWRQTNDAETKPVVDLFYRNVAIACDT